jgi:hypothetical protein
MRKAKRHVWRTSPWLLAAFGVGLLHLGSGCAGLTGLRSVAPDHPSILGLWDKPEVGSPTPGHDHYAQNVHAEQKRLGTESNARDGSLLAQQSPLDPLDESTRPDSPSKEAGAAGTDNWRANAKVYVTLGRPEPLPALALAERSAELASTDSPNSWRAERLADRSGAAQRDEPGSALSPDLTLPAQARVKERTGQPTSTEGNEFLAQAEAKLRALKTYKVKVSRVERVGSQLQPREELSLSVRTKPKAVRLEWSEGPNKGREVIYSTAVDPKMMFVHMANSAIPLPAMRIAVDSPLVMKNSRHSITEAGLDTVIDKLRKAGRQEGDADNQDKLEYRGPQKAPGLDHPCNEFVVRSTAGELWKVYLDPRSNLPCLVVGEDRRGELIERYVYGDIEPNPPDLALAEAFEPDKRWGDSKGLLSRLARAATAPDLPAASQTRTR